MPQHQQYPTNDQRLHQAPSTSLPTGASRNTAPRHTQPNQSMWFNPTNATTQPRATPYLDTPWQRYQSDQPDRGYQQKKDKGVYQIESDATEQQPKSFHTTFEPEKEELAYSDDGFDEVFVNFVGIEVVCSKCRSSFPSKSKLHTQIKSVYVGDASLSASPQLSSFIPVIVSKAMHTFLGSGFSFRGWTYATTAVTLAPEHFPQSSDSDSTACLDTGCGVTLIDKHWLLKRLPDQKISTMSTSLKIRGIGASKHESSEFATLSLYFPGKNGVGDLVYAALQCEIHLVEGLRANLLIGNNIMSPEAMAIDLGKKTALTDACGVTINMKMK